MWNANKNMAQNLDRLKKFLRFLKTKNVENYNQPKSRTSSFEVEHQNVAKIYSNRVTYTVYK